MNNRVELAIFFGKLGFKVGAEIGVARGSYSEELCKNIPELKLYCVDSWEINSIKKADYRIRMYEIAKRRLSKFNVELIKKFSMDAVRSFNFDSLDFVYIDTNHKFDYVMEDIIRWSRRVRRGGIVAGDDYNQFVKEAVDCYARNHNYQLHLTSTDYNWWFIRE